jgi:hypothetical protein
LKLPYCWLGISELKRVSIYLIVKGCHNKEMKKDNKKDIHSKEELNKKDRDLKRKSRDKDEKLELFNETKVEPLSSTRKNLTDEYCLSVL